MARGVGDLAGITARLPYVAALGVDGIWLSPFFTSPMRDFGYDVSDHRGVDPLFGTLADVDQLLAEAHRLGLKVVIDQVWSHTAAEHPWFQESRASRDKPAGRLVCLGRCPRRRQPADQLAELDGVAPPGAGEPRRRQYHLHNFLPQMPDLNFHCAAVQDAVLDIARWWAGPRRGRLPAGHRQPVLPMTAGCTTTRRCRQSAAADAPVLMQEHRHNADQPETPVFLARLRALMDRYDGRMAVAEIGGFDPLPTMIDYTRGGTRLHTAYAFAFLGERPDAARVVQHLTPWNEAGGALRRRRCLAQLGLLQPRCAARGLALGRWRHGHLRIRRPWRWRAAARRRLARHLAGPAAGAARARSSCTRARNSACRRARSPSRTCAIRSASPTGR